MPQVRLPPSSAQGNLWQERMKNMPTFARRPPTMSSFVHVDIPQSSEVGQQRQQISELQFDKFPTPQSFLCWKIRFRSQVDREMGQKQHFYSLPEGPTFRYLFENENNEGFLQKTHQCSRAQSGKFW